MPSFYWAWRQLKIPALHLLLISLAHITMDVGEVAFLSVVRVVQWAQQLLLRQMDTILFLAAYPKDCPRSSDS